MTMLNEPSKHDVLCGRGKGNYGHQGNIVFRELVKLNKVISIFYVCLQIMKLTTHGTKQNQRNVLHRVR